MEVYFAHHWAPDRNRFEYGQNQRAITCDRIYPSRDGPLSPPNDIYFLRERDETFVDV